MANFWRVLEFDKFAGEWPLLMKNARLKVETCLYSCLDEGLVQDVARSSPGDVQWSGSATIIVLALVKLKHIQMLICYSFTLFQVNLL